MGKRNSLRKNARTLMTSEGTETNNPEEILAIQKKFYENLYGHREVEDMDDTMIKLEHIPQLTDIEKQDCEGQITVEECSAVLKSFQKNKTPGNDGLPIEFYITFWDKLCKILIESFNYSFQNGVLTTSQRQAIITLLEKKGKIDYMLKIGVQYLF